MSRSATDAGVCHGGSDKEMFCFVFVLYTCVCVCVCVCVSKLVCHHWLLNHSGKMYAHRQKDIIMRLWRQAIVRFCALSKPLQAFLFAA
jgi:hypothetical protein